MTTRQPAADRPLPFIWLLSDARNDAALADALERLPRGSGFVFRHYHLEPEPRAARFAELSNRARAHGHTVLLSGTVAEAAALDADGSYGPAIRLGPPHPGLLRIATAHDAAELRAAEQARADAVFLSPVFPSRSHPGGATLGPAGFAILARQSALPVIALGGMTAARAADLAWPRWGAIDGLV